MINSRKFFRKTALKLHKRANNSDNYDMARNGESWLLNTLKNDVTHLIDIGYNHGSYSRQALDCIPGVKILGIEAVSDFYDKANQDLPADVELLNMALSDSDEEIKIYKKGGGANASPDRSRNKDFKEFALAATSGDTLLKDKGFGPAQMIKVDTDGYDLKILKGLSATIDAWRPVIQFEFSRFWLNSGARLREAFDYFAEKDYAVGYLMPTRVDFRKYSVDLEIYTFNNNLVAAPKEKRDRLD